MQLDEARKAVGGRLYLLLLAPCYPLVLLVTMPVAVVTSYLRLLACCWQPARYKRFSSYRTFNSSWHRAFGRFLPEVGKGYVYCFSAGRSLKPMFWLTRLSNVLYTRFELLVPPLGVGILAVTFAVHLLAGADTSFVLVALGLFLCCSITYYCGFEGLKYDSLGWAFVGLGHYFLYVEHMPLFAVAFLAISFFSITVTIVQGAAWVALIGLSGNPLDVLWMAPCGLKVATHFRYLLGGERGEFNRVMNMVGVSKAGAARRSLQLGPVECQFLLIFLAFPVAMLVLQWGQLPLGRFLGLLVVPYGMFLVNARLRRFADIQTVYLLVAVAYLEYALEAGVWWGFPFLWISICPAPAFFFWTDHPPQLRYIFMPPSLRPFDQQPAVEFFRPIVDAIPAQDRVLLDIDFQADSYYEFDGSKALYELLHYLLYDGHRWILPDIHMLSASYSGRFPLAAVYDTAKREGFESAMLRMGARYMMRTVEDRNQSVPEPFELVAELDLREGVNQQCFQPTIFNAHTPWLQLYRLRTELPGILVGGEDLDLQPNHLVFRMGDSGKATLKLLYNPGWKPDGDSIQLRCSPEQEPWMEIEAEPGKEVSLRFH